MCLSICIAQSVPELSMQLAHFLFQVQSQLLLPYDGRIADLDIRICCRIYEDLSNDKASGSCQNKKHIPKNYARAKLQKDTLFQL